MNIVFRHPEYVVEIHCILTKDDDNLGVVQIGVVSVPYLSVELGEDSLTLQIPFKDLTIYDHASYEERCASLMDMEKNDGNDRGDS